MTPEECERMDWLCIRIQDEKDPKKFEALVRELNDLFDKKLSRIDPERKTEPN